MARQKVEDSDFYMLFRVTPWWVSLLIVGSTYGVLRFIVPVLLGSHSLYDLLFVVYSPYVALLMALYVAFAEAAKYKRRNLLAQQTSLETLRSMTWQESELLVGEAYRRQGYRVEETGGGGADGGVDLILRRDQEATLVQCKRWKQSKIGAPLVRELRGAVARDRAARGIFVTSGTFTAEAVAEAKRQPPIELVDGAGLLEMVKGIQGQQSVTLSAQPSPECPVCHQPMLLREARRGANAGSQFWGCPAYPRCRGTRQLE